MKEYFKLLKFIKPQLGVFILAVFCMIISAIFNGVSLGMVVPLSDRVLTNKKIIIPAKLPPFLEEIIEKLNSLSPLVILKGMAVVLLILFFLKGIFFFLQNYLMNIVGEGCVRELRNRIYEKFQELSLDFYRRKRTGELISRITNDVGFITHAISYGLTDLIYSSLQIILFTFLVFYIHWKLALISFFLFPAIVIPVVKIGKKIKRFSLEIQKKMADLNSHLTETIQGAYIVKMFNKEKDEIKKFRNINYQYYKYILKNLKRTLLLSPFTEFMGALGAVVILLIAGADVIKGKLSFGVFGLFMGSLLSMIRPFKKLSGVYSINQKALAASGRIYEILEEEPQIREKPNAYEIKDFKEEIEFENVWFSYPDSENFALCGINLKIKKNEVVALVGPSGAGKSTLMKLLPRLYDPTKGKITIDGYDLRDLKLKSLRNLFSVVSQEMILFNDTVRNNIAYGKENATFSEIEEAAKKAYAYDFIMRMPQGFDTVIGERGFKLSGGERQRIAIARAILRNTPILILDEATSQLDSQSERLIQQALDNLLRNKTVFIIAHRFSTIKKATKIVVMDKGRIVDIGTHATLIEKEGMYKRLYQWQVF